MANTVLVQAPAGTGSVQAPGTGQVYTPNANGQFLADPIDLRFLVINGFVISGAHTRFVRYTNVAAANVNLLFSSAALSNGTKAIAAQPDYPRRAQAIIIPGTLAITAGLLTLSYIANDGSNQVDVLDITTALSVTKTVQTSKGVVAMTSQIITNVAGGASPTIQIGTNNQLAVPVNPGPDSITIIKELDNSASQTTPTATGSYGFVTPQNAPAATWSYDFGYTFTSPY